MHLKSKSNKVKIHDTLLDVSKPMQIITYAKCSKQVNYKTYQIVTASLHQVDKNHYNGVIVECYANKNE